MTEKSVEYIRISARGEIVQDLQIEWLIWKKQLVGEYASRDEVQTADDDSWINRAKTQINEVTVMENYSGMGVNIILQ